MNVARSSSDQKDNSPAAFALTGWKFRDGRKFRTGGAEELRATKMATTNDTNRSLQFVPHSFIWRGLGGTMSGSCRRSRLNSSSALSDNCGACKPGDKLMAEHRNRAMWMRLSCLAMLSSASFSQAQGADEWIVLEGGEGPGKGKQVVLVSGDEEYRSEEALPQLAKILSKRHGFKC